MLDSNLHPCMPALSCQSWLFVCQIICQINPSCKGSTSVSANRRASFGFSRSIIPIWDDKYNTVQYNTVLLNPDLQVDRVRLVVKRPRKSWSRIDARRYNACMLPALHAALVFHSSSLHMYFGCVHEVLMRLILLCTTATNNNNTGVHCKATTLPQPTQPG